MGIRDYPIARRSPWQNGHAERLIGSIRRECLDHIVILSEDHLRRVLKAYATYYNHARPHLALAKDAPLVRPVQRFGQTLRPYFSSSSATGFVAGLEFSVGRGDQFIAGALSGTLTPSVGDGLPVGFPFRSLISGNSLSV